MSIDTIEHLFKAEASSPIGTAMIDSGVAGFCIPQYQRAYKWSEDNIERLFHDCLDGLARLSKSGDISTFTFLGTMILVRGKRRKKEKSFTGPTIDIVDGQQRLTTLTLLACALYEQIDEFSKKLDQAHLDEDTKRWMNGEIIDRQADLLNCAVGRQPILKGNEFAIFPRIIRSKDTRGNTPGESEYFSPIAKFLMEFYKYANRSDESFVPFEPGKGFDDDIKKDKEAMRIEKNYKLIRDRVQRLRQSPNEDLESDDKSGPEQISTDGLERGYYKELFTRIDDIAEGADERHNALKKLKGYSEIQGLVRTLLFAAYFSRCVVLTRVVTEDANAAFDIFDALNTTGEPLTAIETLKPMVMLHENPNGLTGAYPSEKSINRIDATFNSFDQAQEPGQTKSLIVSFALYINGQKMGTKLSTQRNFLQKAYKDAKSNNNKQQDSAQRFVSSIADLAEFRIKYWLDKKLKNIDDFGTEEETNLVKLCISLIQGMKTHLTIPILARYWDPDLKEKKRFLEVLKIVTAFLVLRRAATGKTKGIDGDFRRIMQPGNEKGFGLCAGIKHNNRLPSPDNLRAEFQRLLKKNKHLNIDRQSKSNWASRVAEQPLYDLSKDLVRFLILAAADQSESSSKNPGLWERKDIVPSTNKNNFLNYKTWADDSYDTIEHIAPVGGQNTGLWDPKIYRHDLHHSLGNLILLPKTLNCAVQDSGWIKKRIIYKALAAEKESERANIISEAKAENDAKLSKFIESWLNGSKCLDLLVPLRNVNKWNRDIVEKRSRNTATLAWETISPWLYPKD